MTERFLTQAQAEGLRERAREMMHDAILKGEWDDDYETLYWDAIAEATVRPGDAGWCDWHCPHWRALEGEPFRCLHTRYSAGQGCPKEAK